MSLPQFHEHIKSLVSTDDNFPQGIFYILIPEAVDQGVQHGNDHRVEDRGHFVCV